MVRDIENAVGIHEGWRYSDLEFGAVVGCGQNRLNHCVEFGKVPVARAAGVRLHRHGLRKTLEADVAGAKSVELVRLQSRKILEKLVIPFGRLERRRNELLELPADALGLVHRGANRSRHG